MTDMLRSALREVRSRLWRLGATPYSAAVLVAVTVVMVGSAGWQIRGKARR